MSCVILWRQSGYTMLSNQNMTLRFGWWESAYIYLLNSDNRELSWLQAFSLHFGNFLCAICDCIFDSKVHNSRDVPGHRILSWILLNCYDALWSVFQLWLLACTLALAPDAVPRLWLWPLVLHQGLALVTNSGLPGHCDQSVILPFSSGYGDRPLLDG